MKKTLLILVAIVFVINLNSKAEDFSAVHNGKTIYYNITSSTFPQKVEVTFRGSNQTSYNEYSGSISIPDSVLYSGNYYKVTSIGNFAFYACNVLTSITIPNSVTSIGNNAFSICLGLISITIPNSLISIGSEAFKSCNGLTSITIPTSVTSIGIDAFYYTPYYDNMPNGVIYMGNVLYKYKGTMPANTSINIQSSTVSITERAFSGCVGLISITIPNSVTSIGNNTFNGCNGLTSITIPNSVTSIGYGAFNGCSGLTSITIPNSVTSISDYAFYLCSGLTSITFPNSVTSIGHFAFSGCSGGLTSIIIPNSVTSIGKSAFNNCSNLDTVYFNANNCTTMGNSTALVFTGCVNFKTLVIGDSVANIPSYAFNYCSALTSIHSKAITPPAQSNSFFGVSKIIPFYIPCNSISNYNSASYWSSFTNYIEVKNPQFINTSICDGSVYTNYGVNIDSAGVYTLVNGCDSVILNLSITPPFKTDYYDTICRGVQYSNYGFSFIADTSEIYTQSLQAINGCDSIITLYLTINPKPVTPSNLAINQMPNYFELIWQGDGSNYEIYRDDTLIANVTQPIYLDYGLVNAQPYCYKVKALNGDCESDFSNSVCKSYASLDNIQLNNISTKLYPNPSNGKTRLEIEGLNSKADVLVYDMLGKVVLKHKINQGEKELDIDLNGYAKGVYSIRIMNDIINQTMKLIIQ